RRRSRSGGGRYFRGLISSWGASSKESSCAEVEQMQAIDAEFEKGLPDRGDQSRARPPGAGRARRRNHCCVLDGDDVSLAGETTLDRVHVLDLEVLHRLRPADLLFHGFRPPGRPPIARALPRAKPWEFAVMRAREQWRAGTAPEDLGRPGPIS